MKGSLAVFFVFLFMVQCSGPKTGGPVSPPSDIRRPPGTTPGTTPGGATATAKGFIWYGAFKVRKSEKYKELLRVCNRCGSLRVAPGGDLRLTVNLFGGPNRCNKHWLHDGGLQIEFASMELPTEVIVTLQPHYNVGSSGGCWGHPFTVKGIAHGRNKSDGFSISLTPVNGLGGQQNLYIKSEYSNHVNHHTLDVEIFYGGESSSSGSVVLSSTMIKQHPANKRAIMDVRSVCRQYDHSYCVGGPY